MQNKAPERIWVNHKHEHYWISPRIDNIEYVRSDLCRAPEPVAVTEAMAETMLAFVSSKKASTLTNTEMFRQGIEAALAAQPAAEWRSMDSAPKDGTRFLALEGTRHYDCWWHDAGYGEAYWQDEADSEPNPRYWQPLPASPEQGEAK